jgi:hypothetical protein
VLSEIHGDLLRRAGKCWPLNASVDIGSRAQKYRVSHAYKKAQFTSRVIIYTVHLVMSMYYSVGNQFTVSVYKWRKLVMLKTAKSWSSLRTTVLSSPW